MDEFFFHFFDKIGIPVAVALATYLVLNKFRDWKSRKDHSYLGSILLKTIEHEIVIGIDIFRLTLESEDYMDPRVPPRTSWYGMQTISDDILLRIIACTNHTDVSVRDIKTRCKNYFDHMLENWDSCHKTTTFTPQAYAKLNYRGYTEKAVDLLNLVRETEQILSKNASKWFPK